MLSDSCPVCLSCHVCLSVCLSVTLVYCGQTVGRINMKLCVQVCLGPVTWGPSSPSAKWAQPPQFPAHICCGQMVAWIKMPLSMEVGTGPGDFVLDEDPLPSQKRGPEPQPISAHVYCGQTAGLIKMALGTEVGLSPGDFVFDGDPVPLPKKGRSPLPNFRSISVVVKQLDASRCHLVWT